MINTELNANGMNGSVKKTALRDVQNEKVESIHKQQDNLGRKSNGDTVKVCGNKRLTPERPSVSTNENVMNARRRFDLELGIGRLQNSVEKNISIYSEAKNVVGQLQQEITQKPTKASNSLAKDNHTTPVAKVSRDFPRGVDLKSVDDLLKVETERFIRLQKFLKQCDEANQRDYSDSLMHLSASELSKHAVELEKRAILLTIEEGNEMRRLKEMNIFIKPSSGSNLSSQLFQANKC